MNKSQRDVSNRDQIDVYDVLNLFEVKSHAVGHDIKKLLMPGQRGEKGYEQDLLESIDAIQRELDDSARESISGWRNGRVADQDFPENDHDFKEVK